MTNRFRGWCCLIALMAAMLCVTTYAAEEVFMPKVFESLPQQFDVDLDRNMVLYATYNKLHAYDLETGKRRWWKPLLEKDINYRASFGKDYVVMCREEEFLVLDKETGQVLWKEYAGTSQSFRHSRFLDQTNWLTWPNENAYYNIDDKTEYKGPEHTTIVAISPPVGNRILYALKEDDWSKPPTKIEVSAWEKGASTLKKICTIESPGRLRPRSLTIPGNILLMWNYLSDEESEDILRVYNIETGEVIHEFKKSVLNITRKTGLWHARTHDFYFWKDEDEKLLNRLDVVTGEIVSEAFPEDHTPRCCMRGMYLGVYIDTNDLCWFATQDKEHNLWLLPFKHDATPRKLLDVRQFLPVAAQDVEAIEPPYIHAEINHITTAIYRLEGLEKVVERPGTMGVYNADRTLVATSIREDDGDTTHLFHDNEETPLFKVKGEPLTLSPDERYLVVEAHTPPPATPVKGEKTSMARYNPNTTIHIIDLESQQAVAQSESYRFSRVAAFSPDTHYFAFYSRNGLKLMDTVSGFTEKILSIPGEDRIYAFHLCFSPDSKRLLVSGIGQADIFDTSTGAHIVTLKETKQFLNRYGSRGDFLSRLGTMAGDFIGKRTNLLKTPPMIHASFAKDGTQVITIAENMLIRVWDTEFGGLIRTIDPKLPEQRNELDGDINNAIVLSGNGAYALTYNKDGFDTGALWDVEKGVKVRCYTFSGMYIDHAAVSESGDIVYAMINGDLHYLPGAKKQSSL